MNPDLSALDALLNHAERLHDQLVQHMPLVATWAEQELVDARAAHHQVQCELDAWARLTDELRAEAEVHEMREAA